MFAEDRTRKYQLLYLRILSEKKALIKQVDELKTKINNLEEQIKKTKTATETTKTFKNENKTTVSSKTQKKKKEKTKITPEVAISDEATKAKGSNDDNSNNPD